MRLALIVEYDGGDYHGFQYQANAPTIQEELQKAVLRFTGEEVRVSGAGRTDAGVHAEGQVVAFDTDSGHRPERFEKALNFYLPEDISVRGAYRVEGDFDPRRDASSRTYRYTILNRASR
ncbi:MAG: tRNA pseudouridine synthase A, partial [Chloroflexi bacterium]|nr:tRNA pseudouridine synthase A [Chloroflexota bacterium]